MKMLVAVLNDEKRLDEILLQLQELGIKGATVIDSIGMGGILGIKIPFIKTHQLVQIHKPDNKTIFSVIDDEEILRKAVNMLKERLELGEPGTGFVFVLPVLEVHGTAEISDSQI